MGGPAAGRQPTATSTVPTQAPPLIQRWPYQADPASLFSRIAGLPWAVLLDSGGDLHSTPEHSRYHILSALPTCTLVSRRETGASSTLTTTISDADGQRHSHADPLHLLQQALDQHRPERPDADPEQHALPFLGGGLGWFGYELGAQLEGVPSHPPNPGQPGQPGLPDMAVGIYAWALIFDHQQQQAWQVGQPPDAAMERLHQPHPDPTPARFQLQGELHNDLDHAGYAHAFQRIQRYLRDGDCYQVNLTRRFHATVSGAPWPAYLALRQHSPAPYGAYLSTPFGQVLCNSPEQFLAVNNGQVSTRPIKGTRPRHPDPEQDHQLAEQLRHSAKDRAENVMIVDLLRNDLGRVCQPGSIKVEQLWQLHSYATVHHLVSTISGQLADGNTALELLRAAFPGGSITGAPKHRAMQIIDELEPVPRGLYCGSIGYLDWHGRMDSNIAIRTLVHQQGQVHFHAGGGIVIDSVMQDEYQETLDKAAAMLWLLGASR